jgi:hypothetical protein
MTNSEVIKYLEALKVKVDIYHSKLLNKLDNDKNSFNKVREHRTSIIKEINAINNVITLHSHK